MLKSNKKSSSKKYTTKSNIGSPTCSLINLCSRKVIKYNLYIVEAYLYKLLKHFKRGAKIIFELSGKVDKNFRETFANLNFFNFK